METMYNTLRELHAYKLYLIADKNLINSECAIWKLQEACQDGTIQPAKARRIYATLREAFIIDLKRFIALSDILHRDHLALNYINQFDEFFA